MVQLLRELIEGGFVGQAIIATILIITVAVIAAQGKDVPPWLIAMTSTVVGWFFRSQAQVYADRRADKTLKRL